MDYSISLKAHTGGCQNGEGVGIMGLKNCPECGKIFVDSPAGMCPACVEQEERDEIKIVDFLRESGNAASIEEIHESTGVKERTILHMMRKGRFMGDFEISYACESCGAPIVEGRVCAACSKNIINQMKQSAEKEAQKSLEFKKAGRMYSNLDKK
ncbi:flagellar protein [Propionispora hippei]|nr:flagellar protein [Propionispora hippei]